MSARAVSTLGRLDRLFMRPDGLVYIYQPEDFESVVSEAMLDFFGEEYENPLDRDDECLLEAGFAWLTPNSIVYLKFVLPEAMYQAFVELDELPRGLEYNVSISGFLSAFN